jgi:hypothetical protein
LNDAASMSAPLSIVTVAVACEIDTQAIGRMLLRNPMIALPTLSPVNARSALASARIWTSSPLITAPSILTRASRST